MQIVSSVSVVDYNGRLRAQLPVTGSSVRWDGKDHNGCVMPAGIYFGVVTIDGKKMVLRVLEMR